MRQAVRQIAAAAGILIAVCIFCRFVFYRTYDAYIPIYSGQEEAVRQSGVDAAVEDPEVLRVEDTSLEKGSIHVRIRPEGKGTTYVNYTAGDSGAEAMQSFRVDRFRTVYDLSTGGFNGDRIVMAAVSVFWLLVSAVMMWHFIRAKGPAFYSYMTVYFAGFSLFALVSGLTMSVATVRHLLDPAQYNMLSIFHTINSASMNFMMLSMPLMLLFAAAMAVSNIALLRHERMRIQNIQGLLASALLVAGEVVGWLFFTRDLSGAEWEVRVQDTIHNTYATVFIYFECMLIGAAVCGIRAAKHEPDPDRDFIIVLGCWFKEDGTLPPLLRGRADRAIDFWRKQKEATGKEAWLIPSGGQGPDEPMPEAEAIRRYMVDRGIPAEKILTEDRSKNTLQNMAFARELILAKDPEGQVAFATTNYHVFRSGVWAAEAGLRAEGMGSRTRWWFWPNAFMRETVGLLQKRWKQEILLLLVLIAFFAALAVVLN